MSQSLDRAVSFSIVIAALAVAAAAIKMAFWQPRRSMISGPVPAVSIVPDSERRALEDVGIELAKAKVEPHVRLVEFTDLECPACRSFHRAVSEVSAEFPGAVGMTFVHFPLEMHRFALPAARAMECADSFGAASTFVDVVFAHQDSLGLIGWGELARRAGIADTSRIAICANSAARFDRIDRGIEVGGRLGVNATPTVYLDGTLLGAPSVAVLRQAIRDRLNKD